MLLLEIALPLKRWRNGKGFGMPKMIGLRELGKFGRYDQFEKWKDQLVKWISLVDPHREDLVLLPLIRKMISQMQNCYEKAQHWLYPYGAEMTQNNC